MDARHPHPDYHIAGAVSLEPKARRAGFNTRPSGLDETLHTHSQPTIGLRTEPLDRTSQQTLPDAILSSGCWYGDLLIPCGGDFIFDVYLSGYWVGSW